MNNKKFLIFLGIVVGLIIVGLIVFWIFKPSPSSEKTGFPTGFFPAGGQNAPGKTLPGTPATPPPTIQPGQQEPLTQLTQNAVIGPTFLEKDKGR